MTDVFAVRASAGPSATTLHAQHGVGLFIGLDSEVCVTAADGTEVRGRVLVVPPDVPVSTVSRGPALGVLYDPERLTAIAAFSRRQGGAFPLDGRLAAHLGEALWSHRAAMATPAVLAGLAAEAAAWLRAAAPSPPSLDRRVARVVEALREPEVEVAEAQAAVAAARISPAHLQALFVRDVGVPMRTFRLWRRLVVAVAAMADGDATFAAHAAGFADLAHFSRTCRKMLGHSPTTLRTGLLEP